MRVKNHVVAIHGLRILSSKIDFKVHIEESDQETKQHTIRLHHGYRKSYRIYKEFEGQ
jgi:hypothetical protein